jgi:hypothetical protein
MTPLTRPGESPEQALRRLERRADYARVLATDAGQQLLAECWRRAKAARREAVA